MREQLIQYVDLLFAGASDAEDIKQEILQNTLDRYDDLTAQGKQPEAAYRLAITGIGDINEILGIKPQSTPSQSTAMGSEIRREADRIHKRILRAVAVALYILCPTPLFVLSEMGMDTIGLCGCIAIVAVATVLMMLGKANEAPAKKKEEDVPLTPRQELYKSICTLIWAVGLALYFIISFSTGAWYITWVLFPIIGAVQGLTRAILDLKEVIKNER